MEITKRIINKLSAGHITKIELAEKLGISRVTLDTRLDKSNWKKGELSILKELDYILV